MAAMNTLISECITHYDNSDPSGAENARRRARLLNIGQRGYPLIWMFAEWEWQFTEASFSIAAGDNSKTLALAAPNWLGFGRNGYLHNDTQNCSMIEKPKGFIARVRRFGASSGPRYARYFSIWNKSIQLPYTTPGAIDFTIFYRITAETLADDATVLVMPDKYTRTVFLPYIMMWNQDLKNDVRKTWKDEFVTGFSEMMKVEAPEQTRTRRIPLALIGAW